jgi:hypothetical protein
VPPAFRHLAWVGRVVEKALLASDFSDTAFRCCLSGLDGRCRFRKEGVGARMILTAEQCRDARALLDLTLSALANLSGVSTSAIATFEMGHARLNEGTLIAIRRALEDAGVSFTTTGAELKGSG